MAFKRGELATNWQRRERGAGEEDCHGQKPGFGFEKPGFKDDYPPRSARPRISR